jgi:hypothetical protein
MFFVKRFPSQDNMIFLLFISAWTIPARTTIVTTQSTGAASIAPFAWLINHQPTILFSQNKPAISNQPAVLFS